MKSYMHALDESHSMPYVNAFCKCEPNDVLPVCLKWEPYEALHTCTSEIAALWSPTWIHFVNAGPMKSYMHFWIKSPMKPWMHVAFTLPYDILILIFPAHHNAQSAISRGARTYHRHVCPSVHPPEPGYVLQAGDFRCTIFFGCVRVGPILHKYIVSWDISSRKPNFR